jgi:hypothetical protein
MRRELAVLTALNVVVVPVSPARTVCIVLTREQIARYERDAEFSTLDGCAKLRVRRNKCHRSIGIHLSYFSSYFFELNQLIQFKKVSGDKYLIALGLGLAQRLFDLDSGTSAPASVPESRSNNLRPTPT